MAIEMGEINGMNGHASSNGSDRPLKIAVVGGGIGGLALAAGLAKRQNEGANIDFQVFEAAPQFKEIGAGVGVGPNAAQALSLLGFQQEYESLVQGTYNPLDNGLYFVWRWGEKDKLAENNGEEKISQTPCKHKGGHTTVHRAHFLDMMLNRVPQDKLLSNKRLVKYEEHSISHKNAGGHPLKLTFQDGTEYGADVLVACDGIKSVIRQSVFGDTLPCQKLKPRFTGTTVYRGLCPMDDALTKIGDKARQSTMYLGKDKHILTFPIQKGTVLNIVAFSSDRSTQEPHWPHNDWIIRTQPEDVKAGWEGWSDDCQSILNCLDKPDKWALHELHDLPTHVHGRVCLMGDSATATLPHQGQGAAMAIESAYTLSSLLAYPKVNASNVEKALGAFDDLRHDRTTRIKTSSNELGRILEFSDGTIDGDKDRLAENLNQRYDWIWGWEGEAEVRRGQQLIDASLSPKLTPHTNGLNGSH